MLKYWIKFLSNFISHIVFHRIALQANVCYFEWTVYKILYKFRSCKKYCYWNEIFNEYFVIFQYHKIPFLKQFTKFHLFSKYNWHEVVTKCFAKLIKFTMKCNIYQMLTLLMKYTFLNFICFNLKLKTIF